jgi:hypothetical protein
MDKTLKIALILTALDKMSEVVGHAVGKSESKLNKFQHGLDRAGNKSMIAGTLVTGFMGEAFKAAEETEIASKKMANTFDKMGHKTEYATKTAEAYANTLEKQIGIDDAIIKNVETKLATFKHASTDAAIQSQVFQRTVKAAFDLQALGIGDAESMIIQLGKAMNDPVNGAAAMKKAGTLEKIDIDTLKIISQTKGRAAAQQYILEALERQAQGAAEKNVTAAQKSAVAYNNLQESIGTGLIPIVNKYVDKVVEVIEKVTKWAEANPQVVSTVAAIGVGLLALGATMKLMNPVISIMTGLWNLSSFALTTMGATTSTVNKIMMMSGIMLVIAAIAFAAYLIIDNWTAIKKFFSNLWDNVTGIFKNAWEWVKNMFLSYTPVGLVIKHWEKIKAFFTGLWDKVKAIFMEHVAWVMGLGSRFLEAGKNIINSIWEGIKSMVNKPIDAIKDMVGKIRDFLPFSPAKTGPLKTLHKVRIVETIADSMKPDAAVKAMHKVSNAIFNVKPTGSMKSPQLAMAGGGNSFNITVNLNGGASQADADRVSESMRKQVLQIMKDEERRKLRVAF